MKALTTPSGNFGPFQFIETLADRYRCDNTDLPFTVVGEGDIVDADTIVWPVPPTPPVPVPESVSRAQGKAALISAGYWAGVLSYVAAITDPTERALAEVALHDTQEWKRTSAFLNSAAAGLGLSQSDLDALFVQAGQVDF